MKNTTKFIFRLITFSAFLTIYFLGFGVLGAEAAFRFISIGDSQNESARLSTTANQANTLNPSLLIFNGDLENEGVTAADFSTMTSSLGTLFSKAFLVRGNHDNHLTGSAGLWSSLQNDAAKAQAIGAKNYTELNANLTFSFDYDNVRFIGADVPGDTNLLSSAQIAWIDQRLTDAENRPELQHAFLFWHGPVYCVESTHCGCSAANSSNCTPSAITSLINKHPIVSATFHGHEHILGWTHMSSARIGSLSREYEQFLTSPSGGWTYNSYVYPARLDYYYPSMGSSPGFAMVEVNGLSFTFNLYKVGTTSPVWTKTFTKGGIGPTPTPGGPIPTTPPLPTLTPQPTSNPKPTPTPTTVPGQSPTPTPSSTVATLIKTTNLYQLNPPAPDSCGITYLPDSGHLLVSDSEVDEMPIFSGVNVFEITTGGSLVRTATTTSFSHEPTGLTFGTNNNHLYFTDDDYQRVFDVNLGSDRVYGTADDSVSYFRTSAFGCTDPESAAYVKGDLYILDGTQRKVYQTSLTGNLISTLDLSGTSYGLQDSEGITYDPDSDTLYVIDGANKSLIEITTTGTLIRKINISAARAVLPGDLAIAPSSSTSDNPSVKSLYIVDRGVDNDTNPSENDGKMYEMSISFSNVPTGNPTMPPSSTPLPSPRPTPQRIPGDANNDQLVNEADYAVWKNYYNQNVTAGDYSRGDFSDNLVSADGKVNGLDYAVWFNHYTTSSPTNTPVPPTATPTNTPPPSATPTPPPNATPTPTGPPTGKRITKYYGVDRANPITDENYSLLSQHAVKTVVVDTDVHGSVSSWQNMVNLATKYNFNIVVWPSDWTKPVPNCGWESPYAPQNGDFISRVKPLLDAIGGNPRIIGIVNAHEPMWSCITTVRDMETIKNQLKDYVAAKFGRTDFKVWNYIDNVYDMRYLSDYTGPADIGKVMDVAVTWQHCFGGAEGTCQQAQSKIVTDRNLINSAGLDGKVDLVYLFQTFAMGSGYRMPTYQEMYDWSKNFLATNALDGFMFYTWGACWYSSDLYCPASTHPNQNLWANMNDIYNQFVIKN